MRWVACHADGGIQVLNSVYCLLDMLKEAVATKDELQTLYVPPLPSFITFSSLHAGLLQRAAVVCVSW